LMMSAHVSYSASRNVKISRSKTHRRDNRALMKVD
jgi:hypothetical protein